MWALCMPSVGRNLMCCAGSGSIICEVPLLAVHNRFSVSCLYAQCWKSFDVLSRIRLDMRGASSRNGQIRFQMGRLCAQCWKSFDSPSQVSLDMRGTSPRSAQPLPSGPFVCPVETCVCAEPDQARHARRLSSLWKWAPTLEQCPLFGKAVSDLGADPKTVTDVLEVHSRNASSNTRGTLTSRSIFGRQLELDSTCRRPAGVRSEGGWCHDSSCRKTPTSISVPC